MPKRCDKRQGLVKLLVVHLQVRCPTVSVCHLRPLSLGTLGALVKGARSPLWDDGSREKTASCDCNGDKHGGDACGYQDSLVRSYATLALTTTWRLSSVE